MQSTPKKIPEFLSGGGEMGDRIRNFDWSKTPLCAPEAWEQSLKTCVRIMLTSSQPIWIGWGNELIKLYNDPYKAIVGGKHPWALGQPASVVWSDIWKDIEPLLKQVMEKDEGTYVESQMLIMERNNYPEETYYTFSYTPIPGDRGGTAGMICANTDDTARIVNERALQTLRDLGRLSLEEKSITGIYTKAAAVLSKNNKDFPCASIYEMNGDDMIAKAVAWAGEKEDYNVFPQLIDVQNPVEGTKNICRAITRNEIVVSENNGRRMNAPKGFWNIPPKQFVHIPIRLGNNKLPGAILTAGLNPFRKYDSIYQQFVQLVADQLSLDINNLYVLEEERKRSEALAEIDKAKTVFFNNISHEFRTPLTLILSPLEELMQQPQNEISGQHLKSIATTHRNAMRLLKLVNSLLDFSRIESGRQQANFIRVDIVAYTKNLAGSFRSVIEKAGLEFIVEADAITQQVYIDKLMWEKIVFNLLSNAFKYTLSGSIRLKIYAENNNVVLKVIDTGVGIPEKELPHMFERFHRVEGAAGRTYEGTGIGLSMIKELISLHSGTISVESKEGSGSIFTVVLPAGKQHLSHKQIISGEKRFEDIISNVYLEEAVLLLQNAGQKNNIEKTAFDESSPTKTATVLIVDDNADMRDHIKSLLEKNYNILIAGNGADALHIIAEQQPSLVISDIMMPVMDGIALLKAIKENPQTFRIPVILLSARAGEEAKIEGYEIGADDYIIKPFSSKELVARVRSQLKITAARHHTEEQLKNLFLQAPVALGILRGPQYIVEVANEKMLEIWGKSQAEVINKPVFEGLPEARNQGFEYLLETVYTTGRRYVTPERHVHLARHGKLEELYVKFVYEALYEEDGTISGIMILADEITQQVLARKKIEESEEQLRIAIEGGELGTFDFNPQTGVLDWSAKTKEFFGLPPDAAVDLQTYLNALHPDYKKQSESVAGGNIQHGANGLYELEYRTIGITDGITRWVRSKGKATIDENGKAVRFTGVTQDITQRKHWEQGLKESEERFRTLAQTLPQLIWQTDEKGNAEFASARWKEYTGIEPEDEASWRAVVHPDDLENISQAWKHSLTTGDIYKLNVRIKSKSGEYRWHAVNGEPVVNSENKIIKWVGSFTDIHTEKTFTEQLEKQVESRTAELEKSHQNLEEKNALLEKMNKELEAFAYVSSHDLQEPLRKIQIFINRILEKEDGLSDNGKDYFKRIQNAAERMKQLIQDLLAFSRVKNDDNRFEIIDINKILAEVKNELKETIEEKHAIIRSEKLCVARLIPFQFKQLLQNLISNALKFSKAGTPPHIIITSEMGSGVKFKDAGALPRKKYCHISVTDKGIGFDAQFKDQIFELFQRLHTREAYAGTGIGLAIVKKIVDNHNGIITANGEPNNGARFDIYIPVE